MTTISRLSKLAAEKNGIELDRYSMESLKWFTSKINNLKNPTLLANQIKKETGRNTNKFLIGGLYFFYYSAKYADKLPYWDAFPLVLPLERYKDGFLGLNLHYLPPRIRAGFMDKLMNFAIYNDEDEVKRLRITYEIISATKRYKEFKPCVKRYLYSHLASKILAIQPNEWETAVFLPAHQFQKAKAGEVWKESVAQIKGQALHTQVVGEKRENIE
jgi:hypothetical protein